MRGIVKQYPLVRAIDGADFTVELDIDKLGDKMIERIEEKRQALGI